MHRAARLSIVLAMLMGARTSEAQDSSSAAPVKSYKTSRTAVWEPGPNGVQVPLWPAGVALLRPDSTAPEQVGTGTKLVAGRTWTWASNVAEPTMTIYRPRGVATRTAMLVLPGGGYAAVAMDLEGTEICDWLTAEGVTCVVLKYRVPQAWHHGPDHVERAPAVQLPLQDAQRALALLRERADSLGIDRGRIGVIGFSAGGHLAAAVSHASARAYRPVDDADRRSARPDFAVLLYPGHLWADRSRAPGLPLSPWVEISEQAPPTLLIHAMNDPTDDVRHSMAFGLALKQARVPVDLRLYAAGGHAFGLRPTSAPVTREWPADVLRWLTSIGMR